LIIFFFPFFEKEKKHARKYIHMRTFGVLPIAFKYSVTSKSSAI